MYVIFRIVILPKSCPALKTLEIKKYKGRSLDVLNKLIENQIFLFLLLKVALL